MRNKVLEILYEVNPKIADHLTDNLIESGIIDSFEIVNVVMELEEELNIEIDPELISPDNFESVDAIVRLMERLSE